MSNMRRHARILSEMKMFYKPIFQEWQKFYESLLQPNQHCAISNKYFKCANESIRSLKLDIKKEYTLDFSSPLNNSKLSTSTTYEEVEEGLGSRDNNNIYKEKVLLNIYTGVRFPSPKTLLQKKGDVLPYYLMDVSSLLPVLALSLQPDDRVLDMCSSPGGKAVVISQFLSPNGQLVCNEYSKSRLQRLKKVINEYIPEVLQRTGHIAITNWNGMLFGVEEKSSFDKVLVDAPCSSERHVLQKEFQYGGWSLHKMKENSKLQINLLMSGLRSVKPGGTVVYSTCSISPWENEEVVEKVLDLANEDGITSYCCNQQSTIGDTVNRFGEKEFYIYENISSGVLIIPCESSNWGPMYFAKLTRLK